MRKIFTIILAATLLLSLIVGVSVRLSSNANASTSPIQHVILIIMENQGDGSIVGNKIDAPYINSLISEYAFASNYYAISVDGLPNYIGITSGSQSISNYSSDCSPTICWSPNSNIFSLLQSHGLTWKGYAESMPSSCYTSDYGSLPNEYFPRHTSIPYYTDLTSYCSQNDVPLGNLTLQTGNFFSALKNNNLPNFAMIAPNVCNDMHSCPIATGDNWLSEFIPDIISSSSFSSTVIFITFDNGPTLADPIPMIIVGPSNLVNYGQFSQNYTHYSTLATIEDIFNLSNLGTNDATAAPMTVIIPSISAASSTTTSSTSSSRTTATASSSSSATTSTTSSSLASSSSSTQSSFSSSSETVPKSTSSSTNLSSPSASSTTTSVPSAPPLTNTTSRNNSGLTILTSLLPALIVAAVAVASIAVGLFVRNRRG